MRIPQHFLVLAKTNKEKVNYYWSFVKEERVGLERENLSISKKSVKMLKLTRKSSKIVEIISTALTNQSYCKLNVYLLFTSLLQAPPNVVYFNQQMTALQTIGWSKSNFNVFASFTFDVRKK